MWLVDPFDTEAQKRFEDRVRAEYPTSGNRLPTVAEIRKALSDTEDFEFQDDGEPREGRWEAWIDSDSMSTELSLSGVTTASSPPASFVLHKGSVELVADILERLVPCCGHLVVTNDSDDEFFIVGPGVDPYDYIDGDDEGSRDRKSCFVAVEPPLGDKDLGVLAVFFYKALTLDRLNPDKISVDVQFRSDPSQLEFSADAAEEGIEEKLPAIVRSALEHFTRLQGAGRLKDPAVDLIRLRVGPITLRV